MSEVVQVYIDTNLLAESRKVQLRLLRDYEFDFSKRVSTPVDSERIREVWRSVPMQISRESGINKFVYAKVKTGGRGREYRDAVSWLADAGLATRVSRVSRPGIPPLTYADDRSFKLFLLDVGLLGAAYGLDQDIVVRGDSLCTQGKGAYAEQYVCQQLVAGNACVPYYWSAGDRTEKAEVDFVYEHRGKVVPLEVKSGNNEHSRSLDKFSKEFGIERCQRLSLLGYKDEGRLVNLPLFAAGVLRDVL
jgi:predicted AAA+ superfamily ATPase